jgi:sulfotransferase family protein
VTGTQTASDPADARTDAGTAPVFVGGTGRSGTTITARLIGSHPRYAYIPLEVSFHAHPHGLADLLNDRTSLPKFLSLMRSRWYERQGPDGTMRGLHKIVARDRLEEALDRFAASFEADPIEAARVLMKSILDPVAREAQRSDWVEMTPLTTLVASVVFRIFPEMKIIHCIRDGRDVACSVVPLGWGPNDVKEAIEWWADGVRKGEAELRKIPSDRVFRLKLEDLVVHSRERTCASLLEFLGLDDHEDVRRFLDDSVVPERAHIGRWQTDLEGPERQEVDRLYQKQLQALREEGVLAAAVENTTEV